jgi:hypothetical protein
VRPLEHRAARASPIADRFTLPYSQLIYAPLQSTDGGRARQRQATENESIRALFAYLCETLRVHQLEDVRRFHEHWQAEASLALRRGGPEAARSYVTHGRLHSTHPAMVADRVARAFERLSSDGSRVAITTASAGVARAINTEIQRRRNP